MLRIDDFLWYIFMNNNANDNSLNAYTTTINGATLTTNELGISNRAYDFDGVNDSITMGASAYDALIDAVNAGVVSLHINMINNKANNKNDGVLNAYDNSGDFNKHYGVAEFTTSTNFTILSCGGGGVSVNNIYTSVAPTLSTWKKMIYETTYATTKNTGRVLKDGVALGLARPETNQLVIKSVSSSRSIWIGWRQDSPANRSFKGKMNNVFAIKKVINATEQSYINKFGNMKRIA